MLWIYMVTTGSLTAWLLHFLLVAICLVPEILVTMAETRDIKEGTVEKEVDFIGCFEQQLSFKSIWVDIRCSQPTHGAK